MRFVPKRDEAKVPARPDTDSTPPEDNLLQTKLVAETLDKRLLKLFRDRKTYEEEKGVNVLYLPLGFLNSGEEFRQQFAPLILVPVVLDRTKAGVGFTVRYSGEEITTNLSLQAMLKEEFDIGLPELPTIEELKPTAYFEAVVDAIKHKPQWQVFHDDIVLWFFSFTRLLMYRDLNPELWPSHRSLANHPLISATLGDGFRADPPLCGDDEKIDELIQPLNMIHVTDADSSQAVAIEEVNRGRNLIIQGPPGTGKSQTITNIIASAVKRGARVLFVAEKMAALDVVKRNLEKFDLGELCLELHSQRSNKSVVLRALERTKKLRGTRAENVKGHAEELRQCRDRLNRHAEAMNSRLEPAYVTPYQVVGELVRLRASGVRPPEFLLSDPASWTATSYREKQNVIRDMATHMSQIGCPKNHPWRGVQLEVILPTDVTRIQQALPTLVARLDRLNAAIRELAGLLGVSSPLGAFRDASELAGFGQRLIEAPEMDRRSIGDAVWAKHRDEISALVAVGKQLSSCRDRLAGCVAESGWQTDLSGVRSDIDHYGRLLSRLFSMKYWRARSAFARILTTQPPKPLDEVLRILDTLIEGQNCERLVSECSDLGARAFGTKWGELNSSWSHLEEVCNWETECRNANIPPHFRHLIAGISDPNNISKLVQYIRRERVGLTEVLTTLFDQLQLDRETAFATTDLGEMSLDTLKARLEAWSADPESLSRWIGYFARWCKLHTDGLNDLAEHLDAGLVNSGELLDRFQMAYYEQLMRDTVKRLPELAQFDGTSHERLLADFQKLDRERCELAREEVNEQHVHNMWSVIKEFPAERGILELEILKKRKHLPLRQLFAKSVHVIQAIKPVFMMSPLSIAQFLEPGVLEFDLLVIDEASQVTPVDALGAFARAKQVVIVGDKMQLPPDNSFEKATSGDDDEDEGDLQVMESILKHCGVKGMAQRKLRWHYRSRHQSLIRVSNMEFYDNELYVVPSPVRFSEDLGLHFRLVADGVYDSGGSATNRIEAKRVGNAVLEHARQFPDKSLGVGAFSVKQRDAISDELERLRRAHPELEAFVTSGSDPFFVKNLENIQGDERDVIFISVGYAKDSSGKMAMNFGSLSFDGGERRLNVLISRARERCDVFASVTADAIDLTRATSKGARALKTFLKYAETGNLDVPQITGNGFDSEFEREVAKAIERYGFIVETQVRDAGFFIDLAIVDPDMPGRFLLGIECDGATYHSARSARDRDRLRQQVLEDRGWIIHRIWSTDWFQRPEEQVKRTLIAIENARVEWARRTGGTCVTNVEKTPPPEGVVDDRLPATSGPSISQPVPTSSALNLPTLTQEMPSTSEESGIQFVVDDVEESKDNRKTEVNSATYRQPMLFEMSDESDLAVTRSYVTEDSALPNVPLRDENSDVVPFDTTINPPSIECLVHRHNADLAIGTNASSEPVPTLPLTELHEQILAQLRDTPYGFTLLQLRTKIDSRTLDRLLQELLTSGIIMKNEQKRFELGDQAA